MTVSQQEKILITKRLHLTAARKWRYYTDTIISGGVSVFLLFILGKLFFQEKWIQTTPYAFTLLLIPALTILCYYMQWKALEMQEIRTNFSKNDNRRLVMAALEKLRWKVRVKQAGFIEAHTSSFLLLTHCEQMISIVIEDGRILFNSISSVDRSSLPTNTWGMNRQNNRRSGNRSNSWLPLLNQVKQSNPPGRLPAP